MLPPIRCFTCAKVISHLYPAFLEHEDPAEAFSELGVRRDCCKRMLLGHVHLADRLIAPLRLDDETPEDDE